MSAVADPGKEAGSFEGLPIGFSKRVNKASGITITKGQLVHVDTTTSPDSWKATPAGAGTQGIFGMALETKGAGTTEISVRFNDICYLIADGTIEPFSRVQASAATAGQVVAFAGTAVGGTYAQAEVQGVQSDRFRQVGVCFGKVDDLHTGTVSAAADDDLVGVFIPFGGY